MKSQRKNNFAKNKRWKWMAGATAATAAGVTVSQAGTITINLLNNYISGDGGNHLNADLTGDGHPDLTIVGAYNFYSHRTIGTSTTFFNARARVLLNGVLASAVHYGDGYPIYERLGSKSYDVRYRGDPSTLTGLIPIFFKDLHINGGAPTVGSLEVTVSNSSFPTVQLDSFSYNTTGQTSGLASSHTVPDYGSSLALLAMGASGVMALRRWRGAQGQC
jgi:hypothetical protein